MSAVFNPCAKQVMAMAEFHAERVKARLDEAIEAEAAREEIIASRAAEIEQRMLSQALPPDMVAGLHSAMVDAVARQFSFAFRTGDMALMGRIADRLIRDQIRNDAETEAQEWLQRIEREAEFFGAQQ